MSAQRDRVKAIFRLMRDDFDLGGDKDAEGALQPGKVDFDAAEDEILALLDEPGRMNAVESVRIGDTPGDLTTEIRCRGECGGVAYAPREAEYAPTPPADSLAETLASKLGGEDFTVADMLTVRNLVRSFEEHLSQEAHRLGVAVSVLCPCSGDEVEAARALLFRLDPLMEV